MQAKTVYVLLLSYAQKSTRHRPGTLQLHREAGCEGPRFWRYVDELEDAGLVGLEDRGLTWEPRIVFRRVPPYIRDGSREPSR